MEEGKVRFRISSSDPADFEPYEQGMEFARALEAAKMFTGHDSQQLATNRRKEEDGLTFYDHGYFSGSDNSESSDDGE